MTFIGEFQVMKLERSSLYTSSIWNSLLNFGLPVAGLLMLLVGWVLGYLND